MTNEFATKAAPADAAPAVEGMPTDEDLVLVGDGCSCACPFCMYSGGRAGSRLASVLSPSFRVPVAGRVTLFAGDLIRPEVAPLIQRLRSVGASDVLVYAHPGVADASPLRALAEAGLTGVYLMLPAASRDLLAILTGGRGSLKRVAALISAANALSLSTAVEVPVVASNYEAIPDTVARALNLIARPDRVILRFLSEFDRRTGPKGWDHGRARDAVTEAIRVAHDRGVPVHLAHPEAPPPCVLDLPAAWPENYPGFMIAGWAKERPHPFEACPTCGARTVCSFDGRHWAGEEGRKPRGVGGEEEEEGSGTGTGTGTRTRTGTRTGTSTSTSTNRSTCTSTSTSTSTIRDADSEDRRGPVPVPAPVPAPAPDPDPEPEPSLRLCGSARDSAPVPPAPDFPPTSAELFLRQDRLGVLLEQWKHNPKRHCRLPWEELEAHDIRGTITPCAGGWPLDEAVNRCTSWRDDGLLGAWNSAGMQAFRRSQAAGNPFDTCKRECPAFHGGSQTAIPPISAPASRRFFDNLVLNTTEMLAGEEFLRSRPLAISFSPTLRCPNRCRMCDIHDVREEMGNGPEFVDMTDALYDELLDLLPTVRMLALTGGEPLVSRRMRDVLRQFTADRYPDGTVTVTTNGLLLREPLIRDLSATRIRLFYVSVNAATEGTYEHVTLTRGGLPRVLANIRTLLDHAPHMAGRPTVLASFVTMRSNWTELPAFVDLARSLGVGIRLLPVERDRCGESIFTDEETLRAVLGMVREQVVPRLAGLPWSYRVEVHRLESILAGRLDRRDFRPL